MAPYDDEDDDLDTAPPDEDEETPEPAGPYQPRVGPAEDPFEDHPQARRQALRPLLGTAGAGIVRGSVRLLRGSGEEKLDAILSLPDPQKSVQALAPEEFSLLVQDIGLLDSAELLSLASPRQLQACVDLDAWTPTGELDAETFATWLHVAQEAGPEVLDRFVDAQEDGVLALFLSRSMRVFMAGEELDEQVPQDMEVFASPDGTMQVVANPDDPSLPAARQLIETLYDLDMPRARTVLKGLRWEVPAMLEEDLQQFRTVRLEEMGFLPRADAAEMYAYRDPHAWRRELEATYRGTGQPLPDVVRPYLGDLPRLGLALAGEVDSRTFLQRALALLPEEEQERVHAALVRLAYRAQSARAERPSAVDELPRWSRHALRTTDMGLRFLAGEDEALAGLLLRDLALTDVFRAGHSLVVIEQHRARRLRGELGGPAGLDLLAPDDAALVRGLCEGFPGLAVAAEEVERQPEEGTKAPPKLRPVESLEELEAARARLQALSAIVKLVGRLADGDLRAAANKAGRGQAEVYLDSLLATAIAWQVAVGEARLEPLGPAELQAFLRKAFVGPVGARAVRPELRHALVTSLLLRAELTDAEVTALVGFTEATLRRLAEELGGLDPDEPVDPRFVGGSLLILDR